MKKSIFGWSVLVTLIALLAFSSCSVSGGGGGDMEDIMVSSLELKDFTPVYDGTPVRNIPDNNMCSGTIIWYESTG